MALAADGQAHQAVALDIDEAKEFAGKLTRSIARRGDDEVAERRFGPAFLSGEQPRVARQERPRAEDLQAPHGLLIEARLKQDHVAAAVQAVSRPAPWHVPRLDQAGQ